MCRTARVSDCRSIDSGTISSEASHPWKCIARMQVTWYLVKISVCGGNLVASDIGSRVGTPVHAYIGCRSQRTYLLTASTYSRWYLRAVRNYLIVNLNCSCKQRELHFQHATRTCQVDYTRYNWPESVCRPSRTFGIEQTPADCFIWVGGCCPTRRREPNAGRWAGC